MLNIRKMRYNTMKGTEILKWGFLGWLVYNILKEFSQPANNINHSNPNIQIPNVPETSGTMYPAIQPPKPTRNSLTNLDISKIFEEAFNKTFRKPPLPEPPPPLAKPVPDLHIVEAGNWLRLILHPSTVLILSSITSRHRLW